MIPPEIQHYLNLADESHAAAKVMVDNNFIRFSAAQTYYTMFYLAQAMLLSKGLTFSSHSAVVAAYGREFAKTGLLAPKFHRYIIDAEELREVGHYGGVGEEVTDEEALQSFQWAEEFMQAVKGYLGT
ncbi:MAG: HEPN domain-containing protein [Chloroflexota bacterium]